MSEQIDQIDDDRLLLYLMVVGFHHKKGCLVEYCYPPLDPSLFQNETAQNKSISNESSTTKSNLEFVQLPSIWQTLPSLAIPDGAHNFDSDTVFFHLPHPSDCTTAIYCVSCYRQIATKDLLVCTTDMTRSSVQKSVVAILRVPFYGLVEFKLRIITRAYFNELDFSKREVLRESFHNINSQLTLSMLDSPELFSGLSVRNLFNRFGSQVIVLFKLLLLEKKTIFIMSPIRELSASILTLCSLIPGLVQEGLVHSVIPFNVKAQTKETGTIFPTMNVVKAQQANDDIDELENPQNNGSHPQPNEKIDKELGSRSNLSTQNTLMKSESQSSLGSTDSVKLAVPEESAEETQKRLDAIFSHPHVYYGFPLQIFSCSSYLLPYFSMPYFDVLVNERVRSCIAGSSNQIFKRWENDIDVFVVDNQIEIDDVQLKKILRPTSEDINFMSCIIKSIEENSDSLKPVDIFDESQHVFYEGSDEWIRCHFKNYLLHMLRCSSLDENSRDYKAFNSLFMDVWKTTHNYKVWSSGQYTAACHRDIDPAHPFSSDRLSNIRFKIANLFLNRQDLINQSLNKQAINNVISNARSTVNSWFSNISSNLNQAKTVSSSWNNWLSTAVTGSSKLPNSTTSGNQTSKTDNRINDDFSKSDDDKNGKNDDQKVNETSF